MALKENQQKAAAKVFAEQWAGKGDEKQDTSRFWYGFFRQVLGIDDPDNHINTEKPVKYEGSTTYIDVYIPKTRLLSSKRVMALILTRKNRATARCLLRLSRQRNIPTNYLILKKRAI